MKPPDAKTFLETLLTLTGVEASVEKSESAGHTVYVITTDDSKIMIGHQGETLRALNLLARRVFENAESPEGAKFRIDVNGYYADREGRIIREARQLAERARLFKYDVDMRPLNPYERMVVHEALRDMDDVATESRGEGPTRHIVFVYRPGGTTPTSTEAGAILPES